MKVVLCRFSLLTVEEADEVVGGHYSAETANWRGTGDERNEILPAIGNKYLCPGEVKRNALRSTGTGLVASVTMSFRTAIARPE